MKDVNSMKVQYYRIEFEFDIYIIVEQKKIKISVPCHEIYDKECFVVDLINYQNTDLLACL